MFAHHKAEKALDTRYAIMPEWAISRLVLFTVFNVYEETCGGLRMINKIGHIPQSSPRVSDPPAEEGVG